MEVKQSDNDDTSELRVTGELDMHSSPELREVLRTLVQRKVPHIVVNLEAVSYIDSSGLATLVECMQGTNRYKGRLQLVGVNANIWPVFELARLDKVFEIQRETACD